MNCENALELISASLDGELTAAEEAQLREHLAQCPACRALQAELAGLQVNTQAALEANPPPELKANILKNLPPQKKPAGKVVYWKRWGAMAAAVALVALAAWQLPRFVFDPVGVSPAADQSTAETTEATADLPENPAATFSYASDSTADSADVDADAIPDAGATYGAASPAPAPVLGTGAPSINNAAPRAQSQPTDYAAPKAQSEDAVDDPAPTQAQSAQNGVTDVTDDQDPPLIATITSGDAPSAFSLHPDDAPDEAPDDAPDEAAPADSPTLHTAFTGGAGGGSAQSAPESGSADALTVESRMAKLDEAPAPECWCGVLTLAEYEPATDYPVEFSEDGQRQYTLPAADFQALIETLDSGGAAYELRAEGDDISPDAPSGLVIVPGQPE